MDTSFLEMLRQFSLFLNTNEAAIIAGWSAFLLFLERKEIKREYRILKEGILPKKITLSQIESPKVKEVKMKPNSLKRLKRNYFYKQTKEFNDLLEAMYSEESLRNYYNNIASITISKSRLLDKLAMKKKRYDGSYQPMSNTIKILKDDAIYHELFHMASTRDYNYIGFQQKDIGKSLNEGYTELMNKRYFCDDEMPSYYTQVTIAEQLERLVGKEKMENLYLRSDLKGLINELRKYASNEAIEKFISSSDYILTIENYHNQGKESKLKKKEIKDKEDFLFNEAVKYTEKFLRKCIENKIIIDYKEKGEFEDLTLEDVYLLLKIKNIDTNTINNRLYKDLIDYLRNMITNVYSFNYNYNHMFENIKATIGYEEIYQCFLENGFQSIIDEMQKYLSDEEIKTLIENYEYISDDNNFFNDEKTFISKKKQLRRLLITYDLRKEVRNEKGFNDSSLKSRIYNIIVSYIMDTYKPDYFEQDLDGISKEKIIKDLNELIEEFNDSPKVNIAIKKISHSKLF